MPMADQSFITTPGIWLVIKAETFNWHLSGAKYNFAVQKKKNQLDIMQALESQSLVDCLLYIRQDDPNQPATFSTQTC